jgi:hypothetical protein
VHRGVRCRDRSARTPAAAPRRQPGPVVAHREPPAGREASTAQRQRHVPAAGT